MAGVLEAVNGVFHQLDRRPAVFDREIRESVGEWHLHEAIPAEEIIARFKEHHAFIVDDSKVILPLHEPESADLTGEFLLYYPDHLVPCVVYHDFAQGDLARIPIDEFGETYPAWRIRFWHDSFDPPTSPEYLHNATEFTADTQPGDTVSSDAPLADNGEALLDEIREMIADQEIAAREEARRQCARLPPNQFLDSRNGIEVLEPTGIDVDEYGQQVIQLRLPDVDPDESVDLPEEYGIYPGSEVIIDTHDDRPGFPAEAEVLGVEGRQVELSFYWDRGPENPDLSVFDLESDARFLAGELLNPVPYDRKRDAVSMIRDDDRKRGWLSGTGTMDFNDEIDVSVSASRLNKFQYEAAHRAVSATDVFCIHGPPGTGKTRSLVEIITAACAAGQRVLAVSHSNQAIDNLLVGDSTGERVDSSSLHAAVVEGELMAARAGGNTSSDLVADAYVGNDLYQSDVVCATMSSAHQFGENIFDLVVVDEATQASIPATLIPVVRGERVVLAGDHKQLPPYHAGEHDNTEAMSTSLFDHFVDLYGSDIVAMLRTQYRMNEHIAAFPNEAFYDGELLHGQRNRTWSISTLPPLEAIQVDGEEAHTPSQSYYNEREATVVAGEVSKLLEMGVAPADIGIITPYSGQIGKIRTELATLSGLATDAVKIATVDAFQGSEREAIIVSFVRSNDEGHSGFLTFPNEGPRRLNVALTRARRRCVLVGNFDTLRTRAPTKSPDESAADVYQDLFEHLQARDLLSPPP